MANRVLTIDDVSVTYKNKDKRVYAVRGASLTIDEGDALGIVGESGSGKSTLAMALLRLLPPHMADVTGRTDFLGRDLLTVSDAELRNLRWTELAVVFQKAMNSFSPVHRIGDQIEDIYKVHYPSATREEAHARVSELLKIVNLSDRVYKLYPHELSGGMLQRVSIAVSLVYEPKLLILDEATTALDVVTQGQILHEIELLEKKMNMTRIMITHDMSVVATSCNKTAVMYAGDMVEVGPTKRVLSKPVHPYTMGLLASFPSLRGTNDVLRAIPGNLPDLSVKRESCAFAPRCRFATEKCHSERPGFTAIEDGWNVRCFRTGGGE